VLNHHRSQFHPDDVSANSVLQYAVNAIGVEHGNNVFFFFWRTSLLSAVVVVGHTKCGGATACLAACASLDKEHLLPVPGASPTDPINVWLLPMARLAVSLGLSPSGDGNALDVLVEENVKMQVNNVVDGEILKQAWKAGKKVKVHGWVYDLDLGRLRDLNVTMTGPK
jgi:carbonic anhydrase